MSRRHRSALHWEDLAPLDWNDDRVRTWLHAVRCNIHQVVATARDLRSPRSFRILPHVVARASMTDATRGLRLLLRAAQLGLPRSPKSKPE